jgi:hypothetical protein
MTAKSRIPDGFQQFPVAASRECLRACRETSGTSREPDCRKREVRDWALKAEQAGLLVPVGWQGRARSQHQFRLRLQEGPGGHKIARQGRSTPTTCEATGGGSRCTSPLPHRTGEARRGHLHRLPTQRPQHDGRRHLVAAGEGGIPGGGPGELRRLSLLFPHANRHVHSRERDRGLWQLDTSIYWPLGGAAGTGQGDG